MSSLGSNELDEAEQGAATDGYSVALHLSFRLTLHSRTTRTNSG